ncbi:unnamed protein product [Allacma fusca]|uniref:Phospholipid scramblase n=1 Tax=Allacma fusca TaxID=39272 RepID=A0A8J2L6K5_9HEXA|nr:unnamed protein product [Allacma fusca]
MHFEPPNEVHNPQFCESPDFSSGYLHDNNEKDSGSVENIDLEADLPFYVPEFEVLEELSFLKLTVSGGSATPKFTIQDKFEQFLLKGEVTRRTVSNQNEEETEITIINTNYGCILKILFSESRRCFAIVAPPNSLIGTVRLDRLQNFIEIKNFIDGEAYKSPYSRIEVCLRRQNGLVVARATSNPNNQSGRFYPTYPFLVVDLSDGIGVIDKALIIGFLTALGMDIADGLKGTKKIMLWTLISLTAILSVCILIIYFSYA